MPDMPTLRITQSTETTGRFRVDISLEGPALAPQQARAAFPFEMTPQDHEDLRWYLEDYLLFPHEPAPTIAARIERQMDEIGTDLFKKVFQATEHNRFVWAEVRKILNDLRVEVVTDVREATAIPWELVRDPPHHQAHLRQNREAFAGGPDRVAAQKCTARAKPIDFHIS